MNNWKFFLIGLLGHKHDYPWTLGKYITQIIIFSTKVLIAVLIAKHFLF